MTARAAPGGTARTTVRRGSDKAVADRAALHAILDAGLVAHVAVVDEDGQPYVLPCAYARDGDRVLLHGSTGSRLFRTLADGAPACVTVTLLDGLVLARSVFESSMHYRCVMALGHAVVLSGADKLAGLRALTEHLLPGRWAEARTPNAKELAATLVLALPLEECSVKVSESPPSDAEDDLDLPVWAGVVPLRRVLGEPVPAPGLAADLPVPGYVAGWRRRLAGA